VKGLICMVKPTCRFVGIPNENVHFGEPAFYARRVSVEKKPLSEEDIKITMTH